MLPVHKDQFADKDAVNAVSSDQKRPRDKSGGLVQRKK